MPGALRHTRCDHSDSPELFELDAWGTGGQLYQYRQSAVPTIILLIPLCWHSILAVILTDHQSHGVEFEELEGVGVVAPRAAECPIS